MAKRSGMYKFEKRRKELKKKKKQEEKRNKKLNKDDEQTNPDHDPTIMTPEEMAELGIGPAVEKTEDAEDADAQDKDDNEVVDED